MKVARKLGEVYLSNRGARTTNPEAHDKSVDSILRFRKTVKTKEAKQELDFLIKGCKLDSKKGGD